MPFGLASQGHLHWLALAACASHKTVGHVRAVVMNNLSNVKLWLAKHATELAKIFRTETERTAQSNNEIVSKTTKTTVTIGCSHLVCVFCDVRLEVIINL